VCVWVRGVSGSSGLALGRSQISLDSAQASAQVLQNTWVVRVLSGPDRFRDRFDSWFKNPQCLQGSVPRARHPRRPYLTPTLLIDDLRLNSAHLLLLAKRV